MSQTAIIAGLGPGFGESFARKLAREGYGVGLFARSEDYLESFAEELRSDGHEAIAVPTDITDPEAVSSGFEEIRDAFGPVDVLSNQASGPVHGGDEDAHLDAVRFEDGWRMYAAGALHCSNEALADMVETGDGTILFFGATPNTGDYAYAGGKAAAHALSRWMAREYGHQGVHVAHVIIASGILNPDV